jgi:general secretion pathway protein A
MYDKHYGLSEAPFDSEPDLKYVYLNPDNKEHLSALLAGIQEREGFIVLTGEPGVGKSFLVETALVSMPEDTKVARLLGSAASFEETLAVVLFNLGLMKPDEALSQPEALRRLADAATDLFAEGICIVIFVKEAQDLDLHFLKNLRHLYDLEVRGQKLVRIILCGQPDLEDKLLLPEMVWTRGRKILKFNLKPLTYEETDEYIKHRLSVADYQGADIFKADAVERIWEYTAGIPKKIDGVCHNALLIGHSRGKKTIKADIVEKAIDVVDGSLISETIETEAPAVFDLPAPPREEKRSPLLRPLLAVLLVLVCISLALFFYSELPQRSENKAFIRSAIIRPLVQTATKGAVGSGGSIAPKETTPRGDEKEPSLSNEIEQKASPGSAPPPPKALPQQREKPAETAPAPKPKEMATDSGGQKEGVPEKEKEVTLAAAVPEKKSAAPAPPPPSTQIAKKKPSGTVVIQVAAFQDRTQAQALMAKLRNAGFKNPYVEKTDIKGKGSFYRVRLGGFNKLSETQSVIAKLNKLGYGNLYIEDMTKK